MKNVLSVPTGPPSFRDGSGDLRHEEVFEVLSNERRRRLLGQLERGEETVAVSDLADSLAAAEAARAVGDEEQSIDRIRSSVYSALVQTHLPMMDDAGIVEYDDQLQEVEVTTRTREVQLYLEYSPGHDVPWAEYYLGLAAVGGALVVVTWLGVPPFDAITGIAVAGGIVAVQFASTVGHLLESRRNRIGDDRGE